MWLIAGLGNPGSKYALTRHNIGFMAIDYLLKSLGAPDSKTDFKGLVNKFRWEDQEIVTVKPQTFMNLSGDSVRPLMDFYKIPLENLIVVHDEIDIPFNSIRLQKNRGHGGHNGIRDLHGKLGSPDYIRLKLGVGRSANPEIPVHEHVLQRFSDEEMTALPEFLNRSVDALEAVIRDGLSKASTKFNK
ncbi:MAG TPA: aminoacyl-tRNA hydrolase [Pseudobdellovibrionaceae bacterium]|nr:aminoacyl-tRNA hydrolase [Pseudobdellovibrionaceae bacterium]